MAEVRSFVAIAIEEAIIARLAALQRALRRATAPVAWVRPESLHVTLKFLGGVPEAALPALREALDRVAARHAPFVLGIEGVGGFPTLRRPRVVWVGIAEGAEPLGRLADEVDRALADLGLPREARPFNPHLTLGRVKGPAGDDPFAAILRAHPDVRCGEQPVTAVRLMRSDLSPAGARYTVLHEAPLRG